MRRVPQTLLAALALAAPLAIGCRSTAPSESAPSERATSERASSEPAVSEIATSEPAPSGERVIHVTAKRFEYSPASIVLKKGEPVVLELVSLDRVHGFNAPDFGLRTDVKPDAPTRLRFVPDKIGTFEFHCDVFCGSGHEDMTGEFVVKE